jgi:hypothetical protein
MFDYRQHPWTRRIVRAFSGGSPADCQCSITGADGTKNHHGNTVLFVIVAGTHNKTIESCGNHADCYRQSGIFHEAK